MPTRALRQQWLQGPGLACSPLLKVHLWGLLTNNIVIVVQQISQQQSESGSEPHNSTLWFKQGSVATSKLLKQEGPCSIWNRFSLSSGKCLRRNAYKMVGKKYSKSLNLPWKSRVKDGPTHAGLDYFTFISHHTLILHEPHGFQGMHSQRHLACFP